jgi:leucyl-tRNA synthetase
VEGVENVVEAARREILEETGYSDLKYLRTLGGPVECHFYAEHKDENRKAHFSTVVFELTSDKRVEVSEIEKNIHEIAWTSWQELKSDKNLKCAEFFVWDDRFNNPLHAFEGEGTLVNSGKFDGMSSVEAKKKITEFAGGKMTESFKLRDWIFSRQRYWGEPIPVVDCPKCGLVPLAEKDLPLVLPKVKNYQPTDTGESPLAGISAWVNTKCPKCGGKARRETDTMPNWAGSSWYWLRYADPKNSKKFADMKNLKYFTPVDWYNGGMEHTTLHVLYSRFWHKFLYDLKLVPTSEPYKKRTSHGMILAENGEKMSKSRGNVVNPDDIIKTFGADTLRVYEMFMGPFDQAIAWDANSIYGSRRFLERVWRLQEKVTKTATKNELDAIVHKTIKKVSDDIEEMKFNTAISAMMILVNDFEKEKKISRGHYENLLKILSPFAPHICEEIWKNLGHKNLLSVQKWPSVDAKKILEKEITLVVQINGKVRAQVKASVGLNRDEAVSLSQKMPDVDKWLANKKIVKIIHIPDKLLNFVTT